MQFIVIGEIRKHQTKNNAIIIDPIKLDDSLQLATDQ
jgi:hypothetical protein